jgi:hypothetical protein
MPVRRIVAVLVIGLAAASAAHAQAFQGPYEFTVSGGWAWPTESAFDEAWASGFTLAASFRRPVNPHVAGGFEVAYSWMGLDDAFIAALAPSVEVTGGDMGIFSFTSETDVLIGGPEARARPFFNFGVGIYNFSVEDISIRGGAFGTFDPSQFDATAFGVHGGVGLRIDWQRVGLRIDATYRHAFLSGEDAGYVPVRAGVIFRP